ncbi:MAG: glycosyltransferase family 9 protein [Elusimicrobia bacterium]|nr:glycosyltransferase family 9 protein [Candidatus Obscuribacterium magneticum]
MNVLFIQLRRIGDILLTTPAIAYLKKALPEAKIDFLAEAPGISTLETNPHLHNILSYDRSHSLRELKRVRSKRYDVVFDFMNNPRSRYLTLASGAKSRVGYKTFTSHFIYNIIMPIPEQPDYVALRKEKLVKFWLEKSGGSAPVIDRYRPELFLTKEDEAFATQWMRSENLQEKRVAILLPAHRRPIRRWRPVGFQEVGLRLRRELGLKVYLACGPGEEEWLRPIQKGHESELGVLPFTSLRHAGAVFKKAAMVVCNDSGLMHVAVAVGTPTVTIYGPSRPVDWNPSYAVIANNRHSRECGNPEDFTSDQQILDSRFRGNDDMKVHDIAVQAPDVFCLGCHLLNCPVGHICMTHLKADTVLDACRKVISN